MSIINCHTHIFTFDHIPTNFFPLQQFVAGSRFRQQCLASLLSGLIPFTANDKLHRVATFVRRGTAKSQEQLFCSLSGFYPNGTRFAVHSIDFDYMGAGVCRQNYQSQLAELANVHRKYPGTLIPFVGVDPRRKNILSILKHYVEKEGFGGIKLYPALGFYPQDKRLKPVYEYAQRHRIPVMTHCAPAGAVFGRMQNREDWSVPSQSLLFHYPARKMANTFSHPDNYREVLHQFPYLKLCFAHLGGEKECMNYFRNDADRNKGNWFVAVLALLREYPFTYADISYASVNHRLLALFNACAVDKTCRDKILFGSDYYMAHLEREERWYSMNLRMVFGEEVFTRIACENPKKYLES